MILSYSQGGPSEAIEGPVSGVACRQCHGEIARETVQADGIRVRHQEFIGDDCSSCHPDTGHTRETATGDRGELSAMGFCIGCHDGSTASAECSFCHLRGRIRVADASAHFVRDQNQPIRCKGCHEGESERTCLECHGVEIPHTAGWREGGHARDGYLKKKTCQRCHTMGLQRNLGHTVWPALTFCNRCHGFPVPHPTWNMNHGPAAKAGEVLIDQSCLNCHRGTYRCRECHNYNFCDACHTDGRREGPGFSDIVGPR